MILAIIGCTVSVVSIQSSIAEKKTELEQVQKQIDNLTADNEDLERIQIIFGQQYAMGTERDKELYAGRDRKNL